MKRRSITTVFCGVAVVLMALLAGCTTPAEVSIPEGFARFDDADLFTIVSPEGVTLRVRTAKNEPEQTLDFWSEALKTHLQNSGYALLDAGTFESSLGDGATYEWVAPLGEEDWIYLTAIAVTDKTIAIVEAAGSYEYFEAYRSSIYDALDDLKLNRG